MHNLDFTHWVTLSQNLKSALWDFEYDLESYWFFRLRMLKLYVPEYADAWTWNWGAHTVLLHIKSVTVHMMCFIDFMAEWACLLELLIQVSYQHGNNLCCRKSFSTFYQSEDDKESSQSIRVTMCLASTIIVCVFWGWASMFYIFTGSSLLTMLWGQGILSFLVARNLFRCGEGCLSLTWHS